MKDEDLRLLNHLGFIPGPDESEDTFLRRVHETKQAFLKLGERGIPESHWTYVGAALKKLFDFSPQCLPAFYSNRSLAPWQAAAAWVENGQVIAIQLKKALSKGSFLGLYDRDEILGHEAVHAARSAFPKDPWDEFFAYMTSRKRWRKVLGPIFRRPWEVWPLFMFSLLGALDPNAFFFTAIWIFLGFSRLIYSHWILRKACQTLKKRKYADSVIRAILVRLTDAEIRKLAKGIDIFKTSLDKEENLRWRLLRLEYLTS